MLSRIKHVFNRAVCARVNHYEKVLIVMNKYHTLNYGSDPLICLSFHSLTHG